MRLTAVTESKLSKTAFGSFRVLGNGSLVACTTQNAAISERISPTLLYTSLYTEFSDVKANQGE
jgi:hypothetical protein